MEGQHFTAFLDEGSISVAVEAFASGKGVRELDLVMKRKDGSTFLGELNGVHRKTGSLVTIKDITERKRIEKSLQESEEKYRQLAENIKEVFWIGSPDWSNIFYISPAYKEVWGKSQESLLSNPLSWVDSIVEDDKATVSKHIQKISNSDFVEAVFPEYRIQRPDGSIRWISARGYPIKDLDGAIIKVAGIAEDVTEQKLREEAISTALKEKETLLHEIHHRVKNNMQVINSLLKLQSNNIENEQTKEILKDSQSRVYAMSAVHETLHGSESLSEIDLLSYLSKITTSIFQTYSTDSRRIELNSDINNSPIILNQAYPLGLIINELISNSLKYAFPDEREGKISVSLKKQDRELELIIVDDGVGMPDSFDWKNPNTLGLKLVRTLVENQLDGSIKMESNDGTKFTIKFNIET